VNERFLYKFSNEADKRKLESAVNSLRKNPHRNTKEITLSNKKTVTIIVD
jgi:hypothetical protein